MFNDQDSYFWIKSHCVLESFELLSWRLFEDGAPAIEECELKEGVQTFVISSSDQTILDEIMNKHSDLEWEKGQGENKDWDEHWRSQQGPVAISQKLWVAPPWIDFTPDEGGKLLKIEAKMAFGTGEHESTRLVVELMDDLYEKIIPKNVLDVGTGTGILLMYGAHLGSEELCFTEIDPLTLPCICENFPLNGLEVPTGLLGPLENLRHEKGFELVLCNMIRSEIWPLKEDLLRLLAPGGRLIISGQLNETDRPYFEKWFVENGLTLENQKVMGDWWAGIACKEK